MPDEKLYYTIGEAAALLGETQATLRHWEACFDTLHPETSTKGTRRYSRDDMAAARRIQSLLRDQGYTIEGAKKFLHRRKLSGAGDDVYDTLLQIRKQLYDIRAELNQIKEGD